MSPTEDIIYFGENGETKEDRTISNMDRFIFLILLRETETNFVEFLSFVTQSNYQGRGPCSVHKSKNPNILENPRIEYAQGYDRDPYLST